MTHRPASSVRPYHKEEDYLVAVVAQLADRVRRQ